MKFINFSNAYYLVLIITYLSFLINYKKFRYNQSILYFIAFSVLVCTEIFATLQSAVFNTHNFFTYSLGIDITYAFFTLLFYYNLTQYKKWIKWVLSGYILFNLIYLLYFYVISDDFNEFNYNLYYNITFSYFVNLVFYFIIILNFIFETFNSDKVFNLRYYFPFWITISILTSLVGTLPNYIMLGTSHADLDLFLTLNCLVSILSFTLLIIGITFNRRIDNNNKEIKIK